MRWLLMVAFVPTPIYAEGLVRSWLCVIERLCQSGSQCFDTDQFVHFVIEDVAIAADGSGDYTVNRGDDTYAMREVTGKGLWAWSEAPGDREVLINTGGKTFLWQRYKGETDTSDIAFLTCDVAQ